jgi:hypothetical protein
MRWRDLTLSALELVPSRFGPGDIQRVAAANTGVDVMDPGHSPAHYMPGTCNTAEDIIERYLEIAIQLELAGLRDASLYFLGAGLHTVQDRYAHHEQNAGWRRHASKPSPDDPIANASLYSRARSASVDYVRTYLEQVGRRRLR